MGNKFKYLVGYSLKKRVAKKSFLIVNIILLVLVVALVNIGNIIQALGGDFNEKTVVYVYDESGKDAGSIFESYSADSNFEIEMKESFNVEEKNELLEKAEILVVLKANEKGYIYCDAYIGDTSLSDETLLSSIMSNVKYHFWMLDNSDIQEQLDDFNQSPTINYNRLSEDASAIEQTLTSALSLVIVLPCFMLLVFLLQFLGIDIIEEKSSRSIEVIISNVPAGQHFASKIISTLLFLVIQGGLLLAYLGVGALIATLVSGGITQPGMAGSIGIDQGILNNVFAKLPMTLCCVFVFLSFGCAMYLVLMAVLSSMATSMEDFQTFQTPIMVLLLIAFYAAIFGLQFDGAVFMKILGFIPFFSPILAPVLFLSGTYGILELIIAFVLLAATLFLVIFYGIPLYKASILDYSEGSFFKKIKRIIKKSKYVD